MLKAHSLARVYFVPVKRSPFKSSSPLASAKDRLAMLNLALAGHPAFMVSSCELQRPAPSYTAHTVRFFRQKFPGAELCLMMGKDALRQFGKWKNSDFIRKECRLISIPRIGGISSSKIRARLASGRALPKKNLPGTVERYALKRKIY